MKKRHTSRRKLHPLLKLLIALLIITLLIVAVFFFVGFNSPEKKEYEISLEKEMSAMTAELIQELDALFDENQRIASEDIVGSEDLKIVDSASQPGENIVVSPENGSKELDKAEKELLKQRLMASYEQVLAQQKNLAISMINGLAAQAVSDYNALKASGNDSKANLSKLASEYLAKSQVMESQVDRSFNTVINKMESQLRSEGIDPDPIIGKYKAEYRSIKETNRKKLMDKMLSQL